MRTFLPFFLALCLGCSIINLPVETQPLEERVLRGRGDHKILILSIDGFITEEEPSPGPFELHRREGMIPLLREQLDKAAEDEAVRAVVLKVDSAGGSITAADIIYHELMQFKRQRGLPLVVAAMGTAASGGYYVACAGDRIVAHPTTVTGSIGVLAVEVSAAGLLEKIGIENETLVSGDKKDMASFLRKETPEERQILQGIVATLAARFFEVVSESRKPQEDQLAVLRDGRVVDAQQALKLGLIDVIGYIEDAVQEAKTLAKLEEAKIVTYARPREYRANIYSVLGPPRPPEVGASAWLRGLAPGVHWLYLWAPALEAAAR